MTEATAIMLIGLAFIMIAFIIIAYTFKNPIYLWFSAIFSLIWSIIMSLSTDLLPDYNYIWLIIGAMFFISFILLTRTINKTKKEIIEDTEPEDIKEARIERENANRQLEGLGFRKSPKRIKNKISPTNKIMQHEIKALRRG